jgi:hypothetical protein
MGRQARENSGFALECDIPSIKARLKERAPSALVRTLIVLTSFNRFSGRVLLAYLDKNRRMWG